jgi:hypothetical protein
MLKTALESFLEEGSKSEMMIQKFREAKLHSLHQITI